MEEGDAGAKGDAEAKGDGQGQGEEEGEAAIKEGGDGESHSHDHGQGDAGSQESKRRGEEVGDSEGFARRRPGRRAVFSDDQKDWIAHTCGVYIDGVPARLGECLPNKHLQEASCVSSV